MTTLNDITIALGNHSWFKSNTSRLIYELNYVKGIPSIDELILNQKINAISIIIGERPKGFELFLTTNGFKNYRFGFLYKSFSFWKLNYSNTGLTHLIINGVDIKNEQINVTLTVKDFKKVETYMSKLPIERKF
ncbi:MAG: hypothetical protein IT221_00595 [Fluviicola sp.]|nr:hypothetical protein [Fluviicola sp.]